MLAFIDFAKTNVVGLNIDGKITDQEFDETVKKINQKLEHYDKVRLYVEMEKINGMELKAFFKDLKFGLKNFTHFEREAIVTDRKWVRKFTEISDPLVPIIKVKAFSVDEKEEAKAWIKE